MARKEKPPVFTGWSTTDAEEIERRRWRGKTEIQQIRKLEPNAGPFANYQVPSNWGGAYTVEIRSLDDLENSCTCRDYETSQLGTCKHIEGVLYRLRKSNGRAFKSGDSARSPRIEIFLSHDDRPELKIGIPERLLNGGLANQACEAFDSLRETRREAALRELQCIANENPGTVRLSALIESWRRERAEEARKTERRKNFLENVNSGKQTFDILRFPLFPYQRDGMLHLAFGQRALLADDMGLGKTVQALAACQLLAKVEDVKRLNHKSLF